MDDAQIGTVVSLCVRLIEQASVTPNQWIPTRAVLRTALRELLEESDPETLGLVAALGIADGGVG